MVKRKKEKLTKKDKTFVCEALEIACDVWEQEGGREARAFRKKADKVAQKIC